MFPKLSYLFEYFFAIKPNVDLYTFGFFVALAFFLSYLVFKSEFKRKERLGVIQSFKVSPPSGGLISYLSYGIFGFALGFKILGSYFYYPYSFQQPFLYLFSFQGSWVLGLVFLLLFLLINFYKIKDRKGAPLKEIMHPYELMPHLVLWAAVWGFLGAKLFNIFENYSLFSIYSITEIVRNSGLTFFGGLVFGAISYLIIGYRRGMRLVDLADIGSPGMLVAYGVGRIGCHLSGDGDWGIVNIATQPKYLSFLPNWLWSFKFPHNVLNSGVPIPGCYGEYCMVLREGVYPTSFYEAFFILSSFLILWSFRDKIKTPGMVFSIYLMIIGGERFLIEFIRINYKYQVLGWHLSQAQMISFVMMLAGIVIFTRLYIRKKGNKMGWE